MCLPGRRGLAFFVLLSVLLALPTGATATRPAGKAAGAAGLPDGVVAYYFHGEFRCSTCRRIEALSREALERGFADELRSGRLSFRVVNVEQPGNEHFVRDFHLVTKSLVLVEYRDGKVVRWENLPKIWQLVGNPEAFTRYVWEHTRAFLGKATAAGG